MIVCKVCGTENPDGTQYCESCGVELTPEATQAPAPEPVVTQTAAPEPVVTETPAPTPAETQPAPEAAPTEPTPATPAASAFRPGQLIFKRFGALTTDTIPLQGPRLVVGRFDASTGPVEIDLTGVAGAENISRRHAELFFDGVWKVRDLGSTNGVFIKRAGEDAYSPRLVEPSEIKDGDELAFGNVILVFKEG
ncbi:FHA domain-containing protein [uncultured Meiothermus sp.]|jgi:pSer/pThr/pTyr-binding forkhead associated (FHA) protein|uniref:FHA domain-containing protein n=1 Tax=uncultured Meiothermus sp. TaxID=157471 RepID=UPI00263285BD|nr:FHA domain-containing protein [uncultured Meiothermus sp.]